MIRELIMDEIKDFADEITIDPWATSLPGKRERAKILFSAHMDQIGLMVTHVDEKDFFALPMWEA